MEILTINGGNKLYGKVRIPSAKNSALPITAAALMLDGETHILQCPHLSDIYASIDIINATIGYAGLEKNVLSVFYKGGNSIIPNELCKKNAFGHTVPFTHIV